VFGFSRELLTERVVTRAAAGSQSFAGGLFPKGAPGTARWMYAVAYLGEVLAPFGYRRCDADLVARVRNDRLGIAIVPVTGTPITGLTPTQTRGAEPSTKWPKGARTVHAVTVNAQLDLFGLDTADDPEGPEPLHTYFLLMHATHLEVRSELSRPMGIDTRGFVTKWSIRHLLPAIPFPTLEPDLPIDEDGPTFDINVDRL
jgi:hypothetical protein